MDGKIKEVKVFWDVAYQAFDPAKLVVGDLELPVPLDLKGKRVLIVACGTGEHVVRACRQGADVVALDISEQAVANAKAMVAFNGLSAQFSVVDGANTGLPSNSFDLVWGSAVLHHLDHPQAAVEMHRLIAPGGVACFVGEPTFFNPILRWAYGCFFGLDKATRRDRFLFFKRIGDKFEMPISGNDLAEWERLFDARIYERNLMLLQKIGHVTRLPISPFKSADMSLERLFPKLRKYGYEFDFVFYPKSMALSDRR